MRRIAVIGTGQMGQGIARLAANVGFDVALVSRTQAGADAGLKAIATGLARMVKKGKLAQADAEADLERIKPCALTDDAIELADFIIEAVVEDAVVKAPIFQELGERAGADVTIATNTSSLSVTALAACTVCPERVIGMHFFHPPSAMPLVEIVRGLRTGPRALEDALAIAAAMTRTPVQTKDTAGFVVNRLLFAMLNEACRTFEEQTADIRGIDDAIRLGLAHPLGPFALMDLIGLDTCLAIMRALHEAHGERFAPQSSLIARVTSGRLGRKTGAGFLTY